MIIAEPLADASIRQGLSILTIVVFTMLGAIAARSQGFQVPEFAARAAIHLQSA